MDKRFTYIKLGVLAVAVASLTMACSPRKRNWSVPAAPDKSGPQLEKQIPPYLAPDSIDRHNQNPEDACHTIKTVGALYGRSLTVGPYKRALEEGKLYQNRSVIMNHYKDVEINQENVVLKTKTTSDVTLENVGGDDCYTAAVAGNVQVVVDEVAKSTKGWESAHIYIDEEYIGTIEKREFSAAVTVIISGNMKDAVKINELADDLKSTLAKLRVKHVVTMEGEPVSSAEVTGTTELTLDLGKSGNEEASYSFRLSGDYKTLMLSEELTEEVLIGITENGKIEKGTKVISTDRGLSGPTAGFNAVLEKEGSETKIEISVTGPVAEADSKTEVTVNLIEDEEPAIDETPVAPVVPMNLEEALPDLAEQHAPEEQAEEETPSVDETPANPQLAEPLTPEECSELPAQVKGDFEECN